MALDSVWVARAVNVSPHSDRRKVWVRCLRSSRDTADVTGSSGPLVLTGSRDRTESHFERPPPGPSDGTAAVG
jgi:hypothetical protein